MAQSLEILPVEVQISILYHLNSIATLMSVLKASPRLLNVYQSNRHMIYPKIVYGQVTLTGIRASFLRPARIARGIKSFWASFDGDIDLPMLPMYDWKRLYLNHRLVDDMVYDSAKRALRIVQKHLSPASSNAIDTGLSPTEYHRLRRGFYNWEILTSLSGRCLNMDFVNSDDPSKPAPPDRPQYMLHLQSFMDRLEFYELEEMLFVAHYIRERLYEFVDQAEDDRFEAWKNDGPYNCRYEFEDEDDWIWSGVFREVQTIWVEYMTQGVKLAKIYRIINTSSPAMRIKRLKVISVPSRERMTPLRELRQKLMDQVETKRANFSSPLLSHDWTTGTLSRVDWSDIRFTENHEGPNFGLLWGCRYTSRGWSHALLDRMGVWGAAIWDYDRLQRMDVPSGSLWNVVEDHRSKLLSDVKRKEFSSVEMRTKVLEDKWVAEGLTEDCWPVSITRIRSM